MDGQQPQPHQQPSPAAQPPRASPAVQYSPGAVPSGWVDAEVWSRWVAEDPAAAEFWALLPGTWRIGFIPVRWYAVQDAVDNLLVPEQSWWDRWQQRPLSGAAELRAYRWSGAQWSFAARGRAQNVLSRRLLAAGDVLLVDDGFRIWVWTGSQAPRVVPFAIAAPYQQARDMRMPVSHVKEGREPEAFACHFEDLPAEGGCCTIA